MNDALTESLEVIGKAIDDARSWPQRREELEALMEAEPKLALMGMLTNILWQKSKADLVELIINELNAKEAQSLWESYNP